MDWEAEGERDWLALGLYEAEGETDLDALLEGEYEAEGDSEAEGEFTAGVKSTYIPIAQQSIAVVDA